jgi:quercetin dioxygenase-like cupin family protein
MKVLNIQDVKKKVISELHGNTALFQNIIGDIFPSPGFSYFSMWIITLEPGTDNKRHVHERGEQFYFVLKGYPTVEIGMNKRDAKPWDLFYLPPGVPHRISNNTKETCFIQGLGVSHRNFLERYIYFAKRMVRKILRI